MNVARRLSVGRSAVAHRSSAPEQGLSYFSQMLGLAVHTFASAATGMAIAVALIRTRARHSARRIGNYWVDMTRSVLYILLPISFAFALVLIWHRVPQNLNAYTPRRPPSRARSRSSPRGRWQVRRSSNGRRQSVVRRTTMQRQDLNLVRQLDEPPPPAKPPQAIADDTSERKSIVALARRGAVDSNGVSLPPGAEFIPFTAQTRMNGIHYDGTAVMKGAVDAIRAQIGSLPADLLAQSDRIAGEGGTPQSAILSAIFVNALIIIALIPLALRGVAYRAVSRGALLRRNLLLYGVGGIILPFIGIKIIDLIVSGLGLG